jgi:hypothetical protein
MSRPGLLGVRACVWGRKGAPSQTQVAVMSVLAEAWPLAGDTRARRRCYGVGAGM